jgi:hypothetical protein
VEHYTLSVQQKSRSRGPCLVRLSVNGSVDIEVVGHAELLPFLIRSRFQEAATTAAAAASIAAVSRSGGASITLNESSRQIPSRIM